MFVAASTRCFPELPLERSLEKLADLEYSTSEIVVGDRPGDLQSSWLLEPDIIPIARMCLNCRQISPVAIFFDLDTDQPDYAKKFEACTRLANMIKVVSVTVRSAPLGTPYNEEIERLRQLARIGIAHGILVSVLTEGERMTESVNSINSLCRSIPELSLTLDPSWFIYQRPKAVEFDSITEYVSHVRLRDTTPDKFQVQIGQGVLEYGKLVIQLVKTRYNRALCVDLAPLPDLDQESEMRKMRLLIESLL